MHELGVLTHIVKTVARTAQAHNIRRVKHITLEVGETSGYVTYIAGMDTCLCREANQCKDYPVDVACLFLGEPAKTVVKHGLGRFFTYEEACARVDEAARHGLMGQAVWIEVEQMLWGVRNDEMDRFLEICFCCPCCCIAMRLARNATPAERHRFHPSGWTAVPDRTKCIGCGACSEGPHGCPVEAIFLRQRGQGGHRSGALRGLRHLQEPL